ncbi:putative triacylglycerol lipase [Helianthus annuus]|uniref:Putative SGNH hydrolase-type esterase domain-containing protein n=1 Tax=Helianthus annuus TaxID=4232 RepID=A0A251S8V4_HELAN|nr:GDSL esterase/lipase At5g45950 [Helianthus annuus]KAF5764907.1 putative triacylglycerol lipase [Helianthus annuus]KAJ0831629.1 putative triacylglycerol lipase [Helianthus annuus]KAJ0845100.1 putative triacylglycerol lipase [Helianthus annuus]
MKHITWVTLNIVMLTVLFLAAVTCNARKMGSAQKLRVLAAKYNVTSILVFGDSGVDPGNNNDLPNTWHKGNFLPYGKDFGHSIPTGRFTNGRLTTDFIAAALGYTKEIKAYLDRNLKEEDLVHGVSFASGGSGFDDFTANITNVIPLSKQLEYFQEYKIRMEKLVGKDNAHKIVKNAVFVLSMGTNDFLQNYYIDPTRSQRFTIAQYQRYLINCMETYVKKMHSLGVTRLAVVGMEPFGCMPLIRTLRNSVECDEDMNQVALSFNVLLKAKLSTLNETLNMRTDLIDIYGVIQNILQCPSKYGFTVTKKGCCGSGLTEFGTALKGLSTCRDHSKYVYWDAVHFTENMYSIIADKAMESLITSIQGNK